VAGNRAASLSQPSRRTAPQLVSGGGVEGLKSLNIFTPALSYWRASSSLSRDIDT
jgi:hypothetical protein